MASKRKSGSPSKFNEGKRLRMTWNLNDSSPLHATNEVILSEEIQQQRPTNTIRPTPSTSRSTTGDATNRKVVSTSHYKKSQSRTLPSFTIPVINSSTRSSDDSKQPNPGPRLFKLLMIKARDQDAGSNYSSSKLQEDLSKHRSFLLRVFEEYGEDETSVEIAVWSKQTMMCLAYRVIFSGILQCSREVLRCVQSLTNAKNEVEGLSLVLDPEELKGSQLSIYVELAESSNQAEIFASELPSQKMTRRSMSFLMKQFYGISEEERPSGERRMFRFTANEIPALYDHINSYHSKRFSTILEGESILQEEDETNVSLDSAMSSPSGSASNQILDSAAEVVDKELEDVRIDESGFVDEVEDEHLDEVIGQPAVTRLEPTDVKQTEIKIDGLIPSLRKYQNSAVRWMVTKENEIEYEIGPNEHILWKEVKIEIDGKTIFYNIYTGRVASKITIRPLPCGGILADEMGLGKTVEVLALILKNPMPTMFRLDDHFQIMEAKQEASRLLQEHDYNVQPTQDNPQPQEQRPRNVDMKCGFCGDDVELDVGDVKCCDCDRPIHFRCAGTQGHRLSHYFCADCGTKEIIKTHCTLIVSPDTIVYQWIEEIQRHIEHGKLKYFFYRGVSKGGFIQPAILAEYDIIITTYSTLSSDFHYVKAEEGKSRKLRHQKRYHALPSPLIFLEFWRICLDEAQMIQCATARLAEMALRINAVHRWCVTGTPVQRGLEDIYGMLVFIGVFPYCIKSWWNKLLHEPLLHRNTKPLFDILARVMWRTEKKDVLDQINLPKQTETLKVLEFSAVEWHFYKRQEEMCTANAFQEIDRWRERDAVLRSLDKSSLNRLLGPLLRLRQACCHPRAVRDGLVGIHRSHLTMEKLLDGLTGKAKLECEEAHRLYMCAMNGLAALDIIDGKYLDAVNKYREAIRSWAAHKDIFRTDLLQKLHTITNLSETLPKAAVPGCVPLFSDESLESEAKDLTKDYVKKASVQVQAAEEKFVPVEANLKTAKEAIDWENPWWAVVLSNCKSSNNEHDCVQRIKEELLTQFPAHRMKFTTIDGLQFILLTKLEALMALRDTVQTTFTELKEEPTKEMIITAAACCLRPVENSQAPRCQFCKADDTLREYENTIFTHRGIRDNSDFEADENKRFAGLRAETELDVVLKTLCAMTRQSFYAKESRDQAKAHLSYMDLLKQEFKCLRNLWFSLHKRIRAYDELEMSLIRLRLRYPNEKENETYIIDRHEVGFQRLKLRGDKSVAENQLNRKKGQLFYLKNLEKAQGTTQDSNPELCPVCKETLGQEWAVFSCGHCFCCQCTTLLERRPGLCFPRRKGVRISCPLCREITMSEDISFVVMNEKSDDDKRDIVVKGNYSIKVESVVRKILEIGKVDPDGKILVFSTWSNVLDIISNALTENDIIYKYGISGAQKLRTCLADFKTISTIKVLLLPLKLGAKGLNIIEATHVILVEPSLNPANELQAIGRVHRIGQTKPTFVYRFIVKGTVEERIHDLLKTKSQSDLISNSEDAGSTLTISDLSSLLRQDHGNIEIHDEENAILIDE